LFVKSTENSGLNFEKINVSELKKSVTGHKFVCEIGYKAQTPRYTCRNLTSTRTLKPG